jgi:hypothetical protein
MLKASREAGSKSIRFQLRIYVGVQLRAPTHKVVRTAVGFAVPVAEHAHRIYGFV